MKKSIIFVIIFLFTFIIADAKNIEHPKAEIKVSYDYTDKSVRCSDGIITRDIPFILLINKEVAKFYNTHTEYNDSLQSTPQGRAIHHQLLNDAVKLMEILLIRLLPVLI